MGNFVDWLGYLPLAAAILSVVVAPGYLIVRALGAARAIAVAVAPAITFAVVGIGGLVASAVGVRWGWLMFVTTTVLAFAVAALVGRMGGLAPINGVWQRTLAARGEEHFRQQEGHLQRARWTSISIAAAFLIVPVLWLAAPNLPSTQADPMFHYNGVNIIAATGNASVFEAMGPNYGIGVSPATYPNIWHAILALFGAGQIMPATHAFAYIVIPLIWLASLDFFICAALPRHPHAWIAAPVVSVLLPYFPNFMSVSRGFWPNAIALTALPAIYGLGLLTIRTIPFRNMREALTTLALLLLAGIGMGLAHPGAVFAVLWPLIPLAVIAIPVGFWRGYRDGSKQWLTVAGLAALAVLTTAVLTRHPRLQLFLDRKHPRVWDTAERLATLRNELAGVPLALIIAAAVLGLAALAALVLAVIAAWRVPEARWIVIAWFAQWLVVFGAYVDGNVFSTVAGIWYHDPKRAMAVQTVFTTALVALLIGVWLRRSARPALVFGLTVAVSLGIGSVLRLGTVWADARPPIGPEHPIDSPAEIAVLESLDSLMPTGSVIVGDATTGLGYAPSYSRVNVVFPQVNHRTSDIDGGYLRENFRNIHTDPHVCSILKQHGIAYYYEDAPIVYQKKDRSNTWPGLYGVDTSRGFTQLATSDGGTLWRIDACGPLPEPNWWDISARFAATPKETALP